MSLTPVQYNAVFSLGSNSAVNWVAKKHLSAGSGYSPCDGAVISGIEDAVHLLVARGEIGMRKEYLKYAGVDANKRHMVVDTEVGSLFIGTWRSSDIAAQYRKIKLVWDRRVKRVLRVLNDPNAHPLFVWVGTGYDKQEALDQYYPPRFRKEYGYDLALAQEAISTLRSNFPAQSILLYIDYDANLPLPELRYADSTLIACSHGCVTPEPEENKEEFYEGLLQEFGVVFSDILQPAPDKDIYTQAFHIADRNSCILKVKDVDWEDYLVVDLNLKEAYRETIPDVKYRVTAYEANKVIEIVPVDGFCTWRRYCLPKGKNVWQRTFKRTAYFFPELEAGDKKKEVVQEPADPQMWEWAENLQVTSLWVGKTLPIWAQLSIKSWLAKGHRYRLYTYEPCTNIPDGVDVWDAWDVLPEAAIFPEYSYHNFSYWWRWAWLAKEGGIWVDTDMVCLKESIPITHDAPVIPRGFRSEGILSFPAKHILPIMMACLGEDPAWVAPWDSEVTVLRKNRIATEIQPDVEQRRKSAPYGYAKLQCHLGGISKMSYDYWYWDPSICYGPYWRTPLNLYTAGNSLDAIRKTDTFALHLRGTWAEKKGVFKQLPQDCIFAELLRQYDLALTDK